MSNQAIDHRAARRLVRASVLGLHRRFNHVVTFAASENIAIITAPNGFGKTAFIEILDGILNLSPSPLMNHNFDEFEIEFSDGYRLVVTRNPHAPSLPFEDYDVDSEEDSDELERIKKLTLRMTLFNRGEQVADVNWGSIEAAHGRPISSIERELPFISRAGPSTWRDMRTGVILTREQVRELTYHRFRPSRENRTAYEFLVDFLRGSRSRLIGAQRTVAISSRPDQDPAGGYLMGVHERSAKLRDRVKRAGARYAAMSQELDSSFPFRVVRDANRNLSWSQGITPADTQKNLHELSSRRAEFIDAGLVIRSDEEIALSEGQLSDPVIRSVLGVYVEDANKKLDSIQETKEKVELFLETINSKYSFKSVAIGADSAVEISSIEGLRLNIGDLSSGEQHEFILLYDMIFESSEYPLLIIDEPEISLHITWQKTFLGDLEKIARIAGGQTIIATHSPQIIGGRWEIVTEFGVEDDFDA